MSARGAGTKSPELRFDPPPDCPDPSSLVADLDTLLRTRLLIQANSGGGKSHAIRAMLEQTHGRVLHLVLDPEGEFATLREQFPYVLAGKEGDVPAHPKVARVLCRRLMEAGASAIIDLYDLTLSERREFVKLFLTELMALPRTLWQPTLVVLDEAHLFVPERGSGESQSTDAVIAVCTQGRKRGFCPVLATQRISKLHKDAAAELLNKLVGRTALDVDMKRAGDELGMDREQRLTLRDLAPGEFYAYGPALGGRVQRVTSAPVRTRHQAAATAGLVLSPTADVAALVAQLGDIPALASREAETVESLQRRVRELEAAQRTLSSSLTTAEAAQLRGQVAVAMETLSVVHRDLQSAMGVLSKAALVITTLQEPHAATPVAAPVVSRPGTLRTPGPVARGSAGSDCSLSKTQRRMLSVLVQLDALGVEWPERRTMAGWAGVSHTTGTFSNQLRGMREAGAIEVQGDRIRITEAGRGYADDAPPIRTLAELHEVWAGKFSTTVAKLFRALLVLSGSQLRPVLKADLAAAVGVSHTTGTFSNQLRELRSPGVIEPVDAQRVRLTSLVFPEGLA